MSLDLEQLEAQCTKFITTTAPADAAHDICHIQRVVAATRQLTESEGGDLSITLPAAWLHDCVSVPKNSPDRPIASRLAAKAAMDFLAGLDYPGDKLQAVGHAVEAHSYSAGITPTTLEAQIVQDADRLDALGAIGIARCMIVGGKLDRMLYHEQDPFCDEHTPDDGVYTLDHFYTKLFKLPATMQTHAGREEARQRVIFMHQYLEQLGHEIGHRD